MGGNTVSPYLSIALSHYLVSGYLAICLTSGYLAIGLTSGYLAICFTSGYLVIGFTPDYLAIGLLAGSEDPAYICPRAGVGAGVGRVFRPGKAAPSPVARSPRSGLTSAVMTLRVLRGL
jgi:hypothetical protein